VLSGRGLCDGLMAHPKESYRLWCVAVCDLEFSRMSRPWFALSRNLTAGWGGGENTPGRPTPMLIAMSHIWLLLRALWYSSYSVIRSIWEEGWSRLPGNPDRRKLHVIRNIMCHVNCRTLLANVFGDKSSDLRSEFRNSSLPFPCPAISLGLELAFGSLLVWRSKCCVDLNSVWQLEDRQRVPRLVSCGWVCVTGLLDQISQ
jgi:hypothetical protein